MATLNEHQSETISGRMVEVQAGDDHWQLLPGIPDEITKDKIGPKLPWTTFHSLSRVSRGWRQAIQGRELYNARVRSHSTQTLLALYLRPTPSEDVQSEDNCMIALYSVNDNSCYLLPPIPGTCPKSEIIWAFDQCISLDGKVYVLGGYKYSRRTSLYEEHLSWASSEVYVMDLAGQGQWKQCASMQDPRYGFGCGVLNGKIYVLGGLCENWPVCGSEVYDPTTDAWSPIAPMVSFRFGKRLKVTTVGEELFVYNGTYVYSQFIYGPRYLGWERNDVTDLRVSLSKGSSIECKINDFRDALFAEVYQPRKDEWRVVKNFTEADQITSTEMLMVKGNLHRISRLGIDLYDGHLNSWKSLRSVLSVDIPTVTQNDLPVVGVKFWENFQLVEDKIIALAVLDVRPVDSSEIFCTLLRSDGLGGENKDIVMRELQTKSSLPHGYLLWTLFPFSIQL